MSEPETWKFLLYDIYCVEYSPVYTSIDSREISTVYYTLYASGSVVPAQYIVNGEVGFHERGGGGEAVIRTDYIYNTVPPQKPRKNNWPFCPQKNAKNASFQKIIMYIKKAS